MNRKHFFDSHARTWDQRDNSLLALKLARVVKESGVRPGEYVLDVGTGTGVLIPYILEAVGPQGRILALDISSEMLAVAKEKGFPANVAFIEADMENSNLADEQFDRVILNAVFPHFTNKIKALSEAVRVLKPGGSLTISHPIGREAVNNLHRQAGGVVAEDKVPTASLMQQLLKEVGLARVRVIDEPDFYLVIGYRPERY